MGLKWPPILGYWAKSWCSLQCSYICDMILVLHIRSKELFVYYISKWQFITHWCSVDKKMFFQVDYSLRQKNKCQRWVLNCILYDFWGVFVIKRKYFSLSIFIKIVCEQRWQKCKQIKTTTLKKSPPSKYLKNYVIGYPLTDNRSKLSILNRFKWLGTITFTITKVIFTWRL